MTHELGSVYRVRIVHEDQTEELSRWMNCPEKVAQAITGLGGASAKAYWMQVRNILCLDCLSREQTIVEFPLALTASENTGFPRHTDIGSSGSASSRTSSARA